MIYVLNGQKFTQLSLVEVIICCKMIDYKTTICLPNFQCKLQNPSRMEVLLYLKVLKID